MEAHYSRRPLAIQSQQLAKAKTTELLLENPELSVVKSEAFMKRLTMVAVSSIMYLRDVFPSDAFDEVKVAGQKTFRLKASDDFPGTRTLIEWVKSSFALVESHNLKKMVIVMQKGTITFEMYTLSFTYDHEAILCDVTAEANGQEIYREQSQGLPEDIAKAVRMLVRSIHAYTSLLHPLPNGCELSVKILVDKDTPEDEIPQFFHNNPADDELNFPDDYEINTSKLGKVQSKFISLAVTCKTSLNGECRIPDSNQEERIAPVVDSDEEVVPASQDMSVRVNSSLCKPSQVEEVATSMSTDDKCSASQPKTTNLSEKFSGVSLSEKIIRCICECSEPYDEFVKCVSCSTFQHKSCYKMLEGHLVDNHICVDCHNPDERKSCSVPDILNDVNRKESALYRQALNYCSNSTQVSCKRIMTHFKITRKMAEKIIQRLDYDGCLLPVTNKSHIRNVKSDLKESVIPHYFSVPTSFDDTHMGKENLSPEEELPPQPKRRKILKTSTAQRNNHFSYE